jgi:hypothetical protein
VAIGEAGDAAVEEPLDPLADRLLGQADQAGHLDQRGALGDSRIARQRRASPSVVEGQRSDFRSWSCSSGVKSGFGKVSRLGKVCTGMV